MLLRGMGETSEHSTARLMLLLAEFGETVSQAMKEATGEPDLVGNAPIRVLATLDLSGPQRPADLAELSGMSSGGLSKLLDRMEEAGAIERVQGAVPGDRRGVLVSLTERGQVLLRTFTEELALRLPETKRLVAEIAAVLEMTLR
jgi:DNA-binding MarR family transcriptional regulator